jgi:aspartate racemase
MMVAMIVGVIGGMGPAATCEFYRLLIARTPARRDQDHLHVILDSNPATPDRTEAILRGGESPLPWLLRSARMLESAGAAVLAIPCATAHAYLAEVRSAVGAEVVSMIEATQQRLGGMAGVGRVGLLATDGALQADVFAPLRSVVEVLTPAPGEQRDLMAAIYGPSGVKTIGANDEASGLLAGVARALVDRGAQAIVAGCTEIPLALPGDAAGVPVLDTLEILAEAVVRRAR